ncbi:MAG: hypothetical protein NXI21_13215 [Alphaproteobacteria bacterium]|nr:hypothetical protein [Alphaproteobacteria bacterium]
MPWILNSRGLALAAAAVVIAACQTAGPKETPVSADMPVIEAPMEYPEGTVIHAITNGEPTSRELIAKEGTRETWRRDNGCTFTRDSQYDRVFSPSIAWRDCNSTGTIRIREKQGGLWPMQVGMTVSYDAVGDTQGGGSNWSADYDCEVAGTARIEVAAGAFDTYRVECRTPWRRMTAYVAPGVRRIVHFQQEPTRANSNSPRMTWQFVRVEPPPSS